MKALTIRQPWASLIAAGVKTIETRSWSTKYRGPLAIHAGKATPDGLWEGGDWAIAWNGNFCNAFAYRRILSNRLELPLGAVVATCTLADVVPIVAPSWEGGDLDVDCLCASPVLDSPTLGGLRLLRWDEDHEGTEIIACEDQRPFGDFTPGRYAWLLTDIKPTTQRCPACWGGRRTPVGGCVLCGGDLRCAPVSAKGRQGLWNWEDDT